LDTLNIDNILGLKELNTQRRKFEQIIIVVRVAIQDCL